MIESATGSAAPDLIGNDIRDYGHGIWIQHLSTQATSAVVSVLGNTLENAKVEGLRIEGAAAPLVSGNLIRFNDARGILLSGSGGNATIQGNDIHSNGSGSQSDVDATGSPVGGVIDATGNWWGTHNPVLIAGSDL